MHCHVKLLDSGEYFEKTCFDYISENKDYNNLYLSPITFASINNLNETQTRNSKLIKLQSENSKIIADCSVHPYDGDSALTELKRLKEHGIRFVNLHLSAQGIDAENEKVIRFVQKAAQLEMIVVIDSYEFTQAGNIEKLFLLAFNNPDTKFVFQHIGLSEFRKFTSLALIKKNKWFANNIWYDIAATQNIFADSPVEAEFVWVIRLLGVEKFMFGTDYPVYSLKESLEAFDKLDLNELERRAILYKNAENLLK
jgi:predicted TIM-barrel fold metal-dependent hydrolase